MEAKAAEAGEEEQAVQMMEAKAAQVEQLVWTIDAQAAAVGEEEQAVQMMEAKTAQGEAKVAMAAQEEGQMVRKIELEYVLHHESVTKHDLGVTEVE